MDPVKTALRGAGRSLQQCENKEKLWNLNMERGLNSED